MKTSVTLKAAIFCLSVHLTGATTQAQTNHRPHKSTGAARLNSPSGTGQNIDVIYQKCDWQINPPVKKTIRGTVTITFKTTQASVSAISFDFNKASFNNAALSVTYQGTGVAFSFPTTGNVDILDIALPVTLPINTTASVVITYAGDPPAVNGQEEGYQCKQDGALNWYVYLYILSKTVNPNEHEN